MDPIEAQKSTHSLYQNGNKDISSQSPEDVLSLVHSLLGHQPALEQSAGNEEQRNELLEMALRAKKFCLQRIAELKGQIKIENDRIRATNNFKQEYTNESTLTKRRLSLGDFESNYENPQKRICLDLSIEANSSQVPPTAVDLCTSACHDHIGNESIDNLVIDESMHVEPLIDVSVLSAESLNSKIVDQPKNISSSSTTSETNRHGDASASENSNTNISFSPAPKIAMEQQKFSGNAVEVDECQQIGPNGTLVPIFEFTKISWESPAMATRALLPLVFSDDVLATHTLSGKPSPAFRGRERPLKGQLDALKVADIIYCVMEMTNCKEREIRNTITTKCADATKKYRRLNIQLSLDESASN